jgi:hypothetical protein
MVTLVNSAVRRRVRTVSSTCCFLALGLSSLGLLVLAAQPPEPSLLISELLLDPVGPNTTQRIELFNAGAAPVSVNGAMLAVGDRISPLSGLAAVAPGGVVVIQWNQTGSASGSQFFTGKTVELNPAQGDVALFRSSQLNNPGEMLAYVQWGAARQARAALAEQAGLWDAATFLPRAAEGQSLMLLPGGSGRAASEWAATEPTPGTVNSASSPGFRGWRLVGARSLQPPSAFSVSEENRLELASVTPGGTVQHNRYSDDAWSLIDSPGNARSAALSQGGDGALELIGAGSDGQVLFNRYAFDQWEGFQPTGVRSSLPVALAFNATDGSTELVVVGTDGQLQHGRFDGVQWSTFEPVGAKSGTAPALAFEPTASRLELLLVGADRAVYHARFEDGGWSAPVSTGGQTALRPALTVLPDGSLEATVTGVDGSVRQNRLVNGAWQSWQPVPGLRSDLPPTLINNPKNKATELFVVGFDRQLRQARRTADGWSLPVSTGIIAAHPPAVVVGAGRQVELLATGLDGNLWHNRFQAVPVGPVMTLSKDVQPIFTTSCALAGCHRGSSPEEGLSLAAGETFASVVGVPSSQASDLNLVEPGDPQMSYLFHKISGTQRSVGGEGTRMPRNRAALKAADIEKIRLWIEQGAEEN